MGRRYKKIVFVDDNPADLCFQHYFCDEFELADEVETYTDPFEALTSIKKAIKESTLPELIFVDINMPVMNGWEFIARLAALDIQPDSSCLVFILSASQYPQDRIDAIGNPLVCGFMSKPLNEEDLDRLT